VKNHHGLNNALGYGKRSMSTQVKLTAIEVNLKRIASILSSKMSSFLDVSKLYLIFYKKVAV